MYLDRRSSWPARCWPTVRPDGGDAITVGVKVSLIMDPGTTQWRRDADPDWIEADRFTGEPGLTAPLLESDFTPAKPRCDPIASNLG